ncbi:MAG: hypothetical protein JNL82_04155 [Myxococcales bacterium]|nr:hypothetical protein [Myxococcales bacterium]
MRHGQQTGARRLRRWARGAAGIALLAGCLPEAPPPWQVDHTIVGAFRVEVEDAGAWSAVSPRADRTIAEVMPGDTIRPRPWIIGPDGPVDADADPPRYFYCEAASCLGAVTRPGGVPDCDDGELGEEVPPSRTCELRGGRLKLGEMTALRGLPALLMVSGTPEGPDADTCLRRLRGLDGAAESLQDCIISVHVLELGPTWRRLLLAVYLELEDAVPLSLVTDEVTAAEPDLFPGEPALAVTVASPGEAPRERTPERGETIAVRPGAAIEVTAEVDPLDAQTSWFIDSQGAFSSAPEVLTIGWLFSEEVAWTTPDLLTVRFTAPTRSGPLVVYALLGDGDGVTGTWLRFEVAQP